MTKPKYLIGIRKEDKNPWEGRVPIVPEHVPVLRQAGIEVRVQKSDIRAFKDEEYIEAGARVVEDLSPCDPIFAVKELPVSFFEKGKTYVFFAHVIKGQEHNMPLLRRMLDYGCNLLDYEKMVDGNGRRVVFFGNYAGLAGMIDTLWAFGRRLAVEGVATPLSAVKPALEYPSLDEAERHIAEVGERISSEGLPGSLTPLVCGFAGYGNVSKGAQRILDLLPVEEVSPERLVSDFPDGEAFKRKRDRFFKVVFKEEHMVELTERSREEMLPRQPDAFGARPAEGQAFDLQDYYKHPKRYRGVFGKYLPYFTILANCVYWDERYPRLVTKEALKKLYGDGPPRLKVLGDISCDVDGAFQCNVKPATSGSPVYVYDPETGKAVDGVEGKGPVVLAVDNLPCELPRESSTAFSEALLPFIPDLVQADLSVGYEEVGLPREIKTGLLVLRGELTPDYRYIKGFLDKRAATT